MDVIVTDAHDSYDRALIGPPIGPDTAGCGAPSDHGVAIARPVADLGHRTGLSRYAVRSRRLLTASTLMKLSLCLTTLDWTAMYDAEGIDNKVDIFNFTLKQAVNDFCPQTTTRVRLNEKFYVSAKLAELSKEKNHE